MKFNLKVLTLLVACLTPSYVLAFLSNNHGLLINKPTVSHRQIHQLQMSGRKFAGRRDRPKVETGPPMNGDIDGDEFRIVVSNSGGSDTMLGVMSKQDALAKARELDLDLVLISDKSNPPVCKIIDYSKFKYQNDKKKKEQAAKNKGAELKEVKMSYKIEQHDYNVRKRSAEKFLRQGHRVKLLTVFRGREMQHQDLGRDLLKKIKEELGDLATAEPIRREGNRMMMLMNPRPSAIQKAKDNSRAEAKKNAAAPVAAAPEEEEAGAVLDLSGGLSEPVAEEAPAPAPEAAAAAAVAAAPAPVSAGE